MASRRALKALLKAARPARAAVELEVTAPASRAFHTNRCKAASFVQPVASTGQSQKLADSHRNVLRLNQCGPQSLSHASVMKSRRAFSAAADYPPHTDIAMPSLSPTMTQGNIAKWRKKEGEEIAAGDVLCEIETDKATLEMESMEDGVLAKILKGDGSKDIPVGEPICVVVEDAADADKFKDYEPSGGDAKPAPQSSPPPPEQPEAPKSEPEPKKSQPPPAAKQASSPPPKPSAPKDRKFASPAAKKLAEEKGVSITEIEGTGPNGSVIKADVEDYLAKGPAPAAQAEAQAPAPSKEGDYVDIPHTMIRKITAQRLLQSKQTIPHYYLSIDVSVDKLIELREKLNAAQAASGGKKLSLNDFIIKASALALKKVPEANASWTDEFIRQYKYIDISVAVQTPQGLMVPIIKDADKKGLGTISETVKQLAEKAKQNKLSPQEFQGGTFTVSNLGMYGIKNFCAIINPPQACILAVGTTQKRVLPPAGPDGSYEAGSFMNVTLSCDHRVVDGAIGAQWLGAFKGYLEDPITMIL